MPEVNWPALCVGVIVGAYWARVLKLVHKTRRRTGRAANFLPVEPLGRIIRIAWYPTVMLWITLPLAAGSIPNLPAPLAPLFGGTAVAGVALAVAVAAFAATWVCWKRMGTSWRMGINPNERTRLVVTGPYAYVRHPIYALSSLLMIASVAAAPSPLMIAVGIVHVVLLQWEARREERHLLAQHGPAYADYLARVGRFLPRSLSPYQPRR